jgi:hypothetical protein
MISTTHITTGAALGLAVGSAMPNQAVASIIALIVGIISHHLFDMILHTDPGSFRADPNDNSPARPEEIRFALPDNIIGTAIVLWVFATQSPSWPMLFGAIGGNLPDVWHNAPFWSDYTRYKILPKYFHFHESKHSTARGKQIGLGILTNAILIIAALYYLFTY